jgi:thiamine biosynthesis lipoprotein
VRVGEIQIGAVATSATYFSKRERAGRVLTPLIDGRTRMPLDFSGSITVIASSCMWADALTKVMAIDHQQGLSLLKRFDARALFLSSDESGPLLQAFPNTSEIQQDRTVSQRI